MGIWENIVEFLGGQIGQSLVDAWRNNSAVDGEIESLRLALVKAHGLIERSECWRLPKGNPIDELLPQLKDAVYEAESVADEFLYQALRNEVEKSSSGTSFLMNWMANFPALVKKAFDRLDKINKEMKETCDIRGIPGNPNKFSETARPNTSTSLETTKTTKVYGREKELDELFSRMGVPRSGQRRRLKKVNIGEGSDGRNKKRNVSVLSIVGMGGVGKTTLAQTFCNELSAKSYFNPIMWVCVSDNFDPVRLTKDIIEEATIKGCDLTTGNLNTLQKKLEETLNSKRFLLVLDDVWSKDWQCLLGPMKGASEGSIVMVTTRSHECAKVASSGIDSRGVINLEGLEEQFYWDFFKSCAFDSLANSNIDPELEIIGKEICSRLKGSPLAAKTIGGLLSTYMDAKHWMKIRDSKMWQLKQKETDILPVLQLSYQYLPSDLKKCFKYCALYPKDFKFTKWELTKLWIMHGFINLEQKLEVHLKEPFFNEDYFRDLIQRSFFQKAAGSKYNEYVIHDLMHDMCQSITKDECFCIENEDVKKGINHPNYKYIRHLSVFQEGIKLQEQKKLCEYEKLFSVRVGPWSSCCITAIDKWCKKLTSIRSLSLSRCKITQLPESIENLKHLQYLDISFTKIGTLPESFCNLYNLVYLNMEGCSHIISLPKGFNKLINLRFVHWPAERLIFIGQAENLAKEIKTKDMRVNQKIENLKYMNKLRGSLTIENLRDVPNKKAAEEARLKDKSLVRKLDLSWSSFFGDQSLVDERHHEAVFQGLCPHPNLEVLEIKYYGGRSLPSWFKKEFLPNLTEINIDSCKQLTNFPDCFEANRFPMLTKLEIFRCDSLVSLELFQGFAFLEDLTISNCPKLTCSNAMVLPPSIKALKMLGPCGGIEKSIPSCLQNLTSLETLHILNCSDLVSIPAEEEVSNLKSLKKLEVFNCARLQSLGGLKFLASLKKLGISNCAGLQSLGGLKFLASLEELTISGCPALVSIPAEEMSDLKALKELGISNCVGLQSLGGLKFLASLKKLGISNCAGLQSLGGLKFLASLEELTIFDCPALVFPAEEEVSNLKSLKKLGISNCAGLQSLGGLKFLASLEDLSILGCPALVLSMTAEEATNMKSLKTLHVSTCAGLQSLGGLKFLASLEKLHIYDCPKLAETGGRNIDGKLPSELPPLRKKRRVKRARN